MKHVHAFCVFLLCTGAAAAQWVTNSDPIFQGAQAKPAEGSTYRVRAFDTPVTRLTDARRQAIPGIVPQYSKRQAWNADESRLLLFTCDGNARLHDGTTFAFIRTIDHVGGEDVFWHPTDPAVIYCAPDSTLRRINISTGEEVELRAFPEYTYANTRGEGNLSLDGKYWAFAGQQYETATGEMLFKDIVLYDIGADRIVWKMPLPPSLPDFDWVSVSPLGNYVVIDYATEQVGRYNGVEVYDKSMNFLWQKPLGYGHSDLGVDANGDEVLVMDVYDSDSNKAFLNKYRLSDGKTTTLLSWSQEFDSHESCRNEQQRGWCTVSTFDSPGRLVDDSLSWLPFEDEVFQVKMDGSREVRRIAHHRSRRFSPTTPDPDNSQYYAEPHATISRKGDRVIWASNWRERVEQDSSVDVYLADLRTKLGTSAERETVPSAPSLQIYPNPASGQATFRIALPCAGHAALIVRDALGRECARLYDAELEAGAREVTWTPMGASTGLYLVELRAGGMVRVGKFLAYGNGSPPGR